MRARPGGLLLFLSALGLAARPAAAKEVAITPEWTVEVRDGAGHPVAGLTVEEDWEFFGLSHPQAGHADQVTDARGQVTFPAQTFIEPDPDLLEGRSVPTLNPRGSYGPAGTIYVRSPGHKVASATFDKARLHDQPGARTTREGSALRTAVTLLPVDLFDFLGSHDWPTARQMLATQPALAAAKNALGETPLIVLAQVPNLSPDSELLGDLLRAGADLNAQSRDGRSALHNAALSHDVPLVEFLLAKGANPNLRIHDSADYSQDGATPLHLFLSPNGSNLPDPPLDDLIGALDAFAAHGADMNARDATGGTPLELAQAKGDPELVRALLDRGAKPAGP